jgi:hypothetical protein
LNVNEISNGWTLEAYIQHYAALRIADKELQTEKILHLTEVIMLNDRRYTNENELRAMALKIKETADRDALELDRASQAYKAERYDVRSEQSLKETGVYATRDDLGNAIQEIRKVIQPLVDYVSGQQGATKGSEITMGKVFASIAAAGTIIGVIVSLSIFLKG